VAFGAAIVVGGVLMHYLVASGLAAWRDKSMMNWGVHLTNGFAIVLAEVSNRLMVRNKPARDTPPEIINKLKQGD
jgi:hypothetical protein